MLIRPPRRNWSRCGSRLFRSMPLWRANSDGYHGCGAVSAQKRKMASSGWSGGSFMVEGPLWRASVPAIIVGCRPAVDVSFCREWPMSAADIVDVRPEVAEAVRAGRPVVALESTLIAHGLPWPLNVDTARGAQASVRHEGAAPA